MTKGVSISVSVRINREILQLAREAAAKENRNFSNFVECSLIEKLDIEPKTYALRYQPELAEVA
jgi:uncharacterized protein (DUF1778 family)